MTYPNLLCRGIDPLFMILLKSIGKFTNFFDLSIHSINRSFKKNSSIDIFNNSRKDDISQKHCSTKEISGLNCHSRLPVNT